MPLMKKNNSIIVYNSNIKKEGLKTTTISSFTEYFNSKLVINDDKKQKRQSLLIASKPIAQLTNSETQVNALGEHKQQPQVEVVSKKSTSPKRISLQKWSITSWLNSQNKIPKAKTIEIVEQHSSKLEFTESKTDDSGIENQCECDQDFESAEPQTKNSEVNKIRKCEYLVEYVREKSREWSRYPKILIDTHCHLDMLFNRINYKKSINDYFQDFQEYYIDNFSSCISVICNPETYANKTSLESCLNFIKHAKVNATIGCHPHFANNWNSKVENYVYTSLSHPKIVAIGECGLDVSQKNKVPMEKQERVFLAQLKIARETDMPIVIHCRNAEIEVFEILVKNLNEKHRIHLHCFTGGWTIGKKFLDKFPNLCIGVTPLISFHSANNAYELVKNIPINRLFFETDSPYFVPRSEKFPKSSLYYSHPAFVFTVVESISIIKNIPIDILLTVHRENVKNIYGF